MSKQLKTIYSKNILQKDVKVEMRYIGSNLTDIITEKLKKKLEGKCSKEGYIKNGSVVVINYSSGILSNKYVTFNVSFECLVCRPVEGAQIKCKVNNVTKAGIRASYASQVESPIIVFVARDHYYLDPVFTKIQENDEIVVKIIGSRYELNDTNIYTIGEVLRLKKFRKTNKSVKTKRKLKITK